MKQILLLTFFVIISQISLYSQWECGQDLIDPRDGKVYKTVQIGSQCWMAENLNIGSMINSTQQGYQMADGNGIERYCWNNDTNYCNGTNGIPKYGAFYEWKEVMQNYSGNVTDPVQGIAPPGWHIPSWQEFSDLVTYLGGADVAGGKLQVGGDSHFEAILTGYRCTMTGGFRPSALGVKSTYFWTTMQTDADNAPLIELNVNDTKINTFSFYKSLGLSVRAIKNITTQIIDYGSDSGDLFINSILIDKDKNLLVDFDTKESAGYNIQVTDILGHILKSVQKTSDNGKNYTWINVSDFSNGIYFVKIMFKAQIYSKKIMIF